MKLDGVGEFLESSVACLGAACLRGFRWLV